MGFLNDYNNRRNKRKDEEEERQRDSVSSFGKRAGREEKTGSSFMSQLGNVSKDVFRTETPSTNPYDIALETARNTAQPETNTGFMERPSVFEPTGYSDDELNTIEQNLLKQRNNTTMSGAPDFSNLGAGIGENNNKEFDATSFNSYVNNVSNRNKTYDNPLDNYGVDKNVVDLTQFDPDKFKNDMEDLANKETDTGNNWWDTIKSIDEGLRDVREKKDINYYNSLADADDFAEMSQYQKVNKPLGNYSDAEWTSYALNEIRGDQADINIMRDLGEYKYATADEVDTFNYLYNTQGADAAMDFYKRLNLSGRMTETATDYAAQAAEAHPVIASAESFVASPIKGIGYIGSALDVLSGKGLDPNAWYNLPSNIQNSIRSQVSNDIIKNADNEFMGKVGSFMYQTGMSMGDFLMNLGTGNQELSLGIMGAGAASDSVIEAKKRGLSDAQALATGTIAGLAEIVSERVSIESLFNSNAQGVKYILQNFIAEGAEEVESDLINDVADLIINGDKAQMKQAYQQYLDEGLSESEAFGRMIGDQAIQYGTDFLGGAISGGIMGSVGAAGQYVNQRNIGNTMLSDEQSLNQIVNLGAQSENEETRALAQQVFDGNAKKNVIGELVQRVSSENNLYGKIIDKLRESGETQGMAEAEADAIMNHISGAELTGQDQEYLNNENVQNALNDVFGGTYDTAYANSEAANDAYSRALEMARQQRAEKMAPVTNAINNVRNIFGNKKSGAQNNTETENNAQVSEENTQKAEETETKETVKNMPLSERAKIGAEYSKFRTEVKPVKATLNDVKAVEVTPDGLSVTLNDGQKVNTHQIMDDATRYMLQRVERNFNDTQGAEDYIKAYNENVNTTVFNNAAFQMNTAGYNGVDYKTVYDKVTKDASFVANGKNIPESFLQDMYAYGKRERDRVSKEMNSKIQKVVTDSIEKFVGITSHEGGEEGQGYYDPKTNEITYGKYTKQSRIETLAHELTHMMRKNSESNYNQIKDVVLEVLKSSGLYDQIFEDTKKTYTNLDEDGIIEEIVANSMQEMLFNETVINELCEKKPKLAQRILNAIRKAIVELRNMLRGHIGSAESKILSQDIEALEKAAKLYAQGLKQMSENMKNAESKEGEIKYSKDRNDITYTVLPDGTTVFSGYQFTRGDVRTKELYGERVKDIIHDSLYNLVGESLNIKADNHTVWVDSDMPGEYVGSEDTYGLNDKNLQAKMSLVNGIKSVIENAQNPRWSKNVESKHDIDAKRGWLNYKIRIGFVNDEGKITYFNGILKVRMDANGKDYVYDIVDIRKEPGVTVQPKSSRKNHTTPSGPTISKTNNNSNTKNKKSAKNLHSYAGITAVNADMKSLTEAQSMLEEGKSKEEVFRETGWFQGADGKWRYEISDDAMKVFPHGDAKFLNDKEYQRYKEIEHSLLYDAKQLSKEETEEFDKLFKKYLNRKEFRLDDIVQHDKLFESYPFLRNLKVEFVRPELIDNATAQIRVDEGKIYVDLYTKSDVNKLRKTLIHEMQHAIQEQEHFAGGASPEMYEEINTVYESRAYKNYNETLDEIRQFLKQTPLDFTSKYNQIPLFYGWYESTGNKKYIDEAHKLEKELEENYSELYDELSDLEFDKKVYQDAMEKTVTPRQLYMMTAGEIEARDSADRADMTDEERKNKYPTRTYKNGVYIQETGEYHDARNMKYSKAAPSEINSELSKDNQGRELTKAQQEYFKDSKVKDEKDNLKVVYHGSKDFGFTVFDPDKSDDKRSLFFTDNENMANSYVGDKSKIYGVYLNLKNPFVVHGNGANWNRLRLDRDIERAKIFNKDTKVLTAMEDFVALAKNYDSAIDQGLMYESLGQLEDSVNYMLEDTEDGEYFTKEEAERLLKLARIIDEAYDTWDESEHIDLYGDEMSFEQFYLSDEMDIPTYRTREISKIAMDEGYDGVIFKDIRDNGYLGGAEEGDVYIAFDSNQIKLTDNINPTNDEDIRFSMERPVEINRDLIAAHNISEENLLKTLKLGGFPMPSIAVTKAEYNPDNFGTISVLFDKNSIDPKVNKANKGYFGDAWTPTVPRTVKKINNKKLNALHDKLGLSGDYSSVFQNDMEDIVRRLSNETQVKEKFIKDNNVEIEKKPYTNWHHPRTAQIFDILKDSTHTMYSIWTDEALKKQLAEAAYPESKLSFVKKAREKYLEMLNHIDDSSEKLDEFMKDKDDAYVSTYMNLYQDLFDIVHDQVRSGWDRNAYRDDVDKYISEHEEEFKKFIEDAINEADMYEGEYFRKPGVDEITNNGRRSFEQLHIPYNAENMLKLMLKDKNAIKGFFGGASNLRGAITKEYKSIEDIKQNEGKLNKVQAEEVDAKLSELNHIILEIDSAIKDANGWSGWVADDDINETLVKLLKKPKITLDVANSVFAKDETKFAPEILDEVIELKKGLQELPVQYFEAKPERVLGFDEIKATIIPDDSSVELKEALDKAGIPYEEYKAGDKEDRLEKLNSHEDLKFSLQDDWDYDWESAMAESEEEKIAEGVIAKNDANILEDGFKALKDAKNSGKVNISHNKAVQIAKRYTEKYDSATGAESLATSIEAVFAYIREHDVSYDDMLRVMRDVTLPVVENIRGDEQFTEEYRDFIKSLKGTSISLNESQKKEVAYAYGSMANFRKAVAGRFNIKEDGVNIDSLWPEIVEQSGYRLDEEENSNSQPIALLELLDQMKSDKGTVNRGMSDNQLALDMALNIYTDCFKEMSMNAAKVNETEVANRLAKTKEILTDSVKKYEEAVDKMYKQMLADTKARAQAEIDRLNQELRELNNIDTYNRSIDTDKRIVQLKRQIDRLKQQQEEDRVYRKTSRQKARENRENSRMRNAIKSIVKDLSSRLANPNKNRYVPEDLVQATIDMLESINLDTKEGNLIKEKVQKVKDAYERLGKSTNESDASDDYDPALYNMITRLKEIFDKGKSVRRLSQSELEDVLTIAKAIQTQIKNANELIKSEIAQKIDETARGVIEDVRANKEIGNGWLEDLANRGVNTVLDPRRFLNRLVGYNEDSKMMQLFDELNEGQHKMMQIQMETSDIFKGILENETESRKLTGENKEDWVETPFKDKKGNPLKIPTGMRLSLAMHMLNEDNLRHIIYGGLTVPDMKLYNQGRKAEAYKKAQAEIRLIDDNTRLKLYEMRDKANELNDEQYTNQEREDAWAKYRDTVKKAEDQAKAKLQSIVDGMTDYERQFLEYAKEYFWNYSGKQINETSMALNGYMKATVENYFPIATDTNYSKRDIEGLKLDQTLEGWGNLKSRVHAKNPIFLENIVDVISKHSDMMSKYAGFAIPIRNFNKVYNYNLRDNGSYKDSVKNAINSQRGVAATEYIENLLTDLQGSRKGFTGKIGEGLEKLRGNFAAATLTANLGVAIKQAASIYTAADVLGHDAIAHVTVGTNASKHFWGSFTHVHKLDDYIVEQMEEIKKYSPLVWYRNQGNSTQELKDLKNKKTELDKFAPTRFVKDMTGNWIQNIDTATVTTLWEAAKYRISKDTDLEYGSEEYFKEVAKIFNKAVEQTQPNYTTLQRPDILRNPNELVRNVIMFATQPLQNLGICVDSTANYIAKYEAYKNNQTEENKAKLDIAGKRLARSLSAVAVSMLVFSLMQMVAKGIRHKWDDYRDENGEFTFESVLSQIMRDFGSSAFGMVPLGSEIYDALAAKLTGGKYYGFEVSTIKMVTDFFESAGNLFDATTDFMFKGETEKLGKSTKNFIFNTASMAGIPVKNLYNLGNGIVLFGQDFEKLINGEPWFFESGYTRSNTVNQGRLSEALLSGNEDKFEDVYDEMLDNGVEEKDINSYLKKTLADYDPEDAVEILEGVGIDEDDAYDMLSDSIKSDVKQKVIDGEMSVDKAMSELEKIGYSEFDAYIQANTWEWKPDATGAVPYSGILVAIRSEDPEKIVDAVNMYLDNGYDKDTLKKYSGIKSNFADTYKELLQTNKTAAASLKNAMLTYFRACGKSDEEAMKQIDGWLE